MPKIEQTIADVNVRSHTFKFIPPDATETLKIPNSCNTCHTDKTVQWAKDTLKTWPVFLAVASCAIVATASCGWNTTRAYKGRHRQSV
jgi:hypothetical protein